MQISEETKCGCCACQRIFLGKQIIDWWDGGDTPVCPYCGVDAIVAETADMTVTPERLRALRNSF